MPAEWLLPFFFFNDTATTEIYTLSLHDALPIWDTSRNSLLPSGRTSSGGRWPADARSEEHTSELQSRENLVCRLLLETKEEALTRQPAEAGRYGTPHAVPVTART